MNLDSLFQASSVALTLNRSVIFLTLMAALTLFKVFSLFFIHRLTAYLRVLRLFRCLIALNVGVTLLRMDINTLRNLAKICLLL